MSIEDLEQHGVLLPKEEWGTHKLKTTISKTPLLLSFLASIVGCILTYFGDGNMWTWIGIGLFFIAFFFVIILSDWAIRRQRKRTERERKSNKEHNDQPHT